MADAAPAPTGSAGLALTKEMLAELTRQGNQSRHYEAEIAKVYQNLSRFADEAYQAQKDVNQTQKEAQIEVKQALEEKHDAKMKAKDLECEVKELRQRLEHGGEKTTTKRARGGDSVQRHSNGRTYDGKTLWPVGATAEYKKRKVQHVLSHGEGINIVGYKKCLDVLLTDPSDIAYHVNEMPRLNVARLNQLNEILAEQRIAPGS